MRSRILLDISWQFRYVHKPMDVFIKLYEPSKRGNLQNFTRYRVPCIVLFSCLKPWVILELFNRERNPQSAIDSNNFCFNLITNRYEVSRIIDTLPCKFRNMHKAFKLLSAFFEFYEYSEVNDTANHAFYIFAFSKMF